MRVNNLVDTVNYNLCVECLLKVFFLNKMVYTRKMKRIIFAALIFFSILSGSCSAWEWSDFLGGGGEITFQTKTLSMDEVRQMRVRDIKRRLARSHGYSADELGRILDKNELIEALSFEEHKEREKEKQQMKRALGFRGIAVAVIAVVVVMGWPLWQQLFDAASVNFVVYTDRKRYEASRCLELKSGEGMIGVILMAVLEILQFWLRATVLLSWFTTSEYFFPIPSLPFRPAQFMGDQVSSGPLSRYGINVGPMALSWAFRFVNGRLEVFTGKALSRSYQKQKKANRENESAEARAERKAARKAAKKAAKEEAEQKRREEEMAEAERRKEAAAKAGEELFPTKEKMEESRKEFKQQVGNFDMDDLD